MGHSLQHRGRSSRTSAARHLLPGRPGLFLIVISNFLIFLGPLLAMGFSQIRGYEPGDAEWGVKLDDVRGQAEAKEEVRRVVTLWQSGEVFERRAASASAACSSSAPRERARRCSRRRSRRLQLARSSPSRARASPQTFIGIDAIIVRFLARKAKKLARKWGGQCIVFIDEIDAVGMRRASLGGGFAPR